MQYNVTYFSIQNFNCFKIIIIRMMFSSSFMHSPRTYAVIHPEVTTSSSCWTCESGNYVETRCLTKIVLSYKYTFIGKLRPSNGSEGMVISVDIEGLEEVSIKNNLRLHFAVEALKIGNKWNWHESSVSSLEWDARNQLIRLIKLKKISHDLRA